jgi:hypothetical protein
MQREKEIIFYTVCGGSCSIYNNARGNITKCKMSGILEATSVMCGVYKVSVSVYFVTQYITQRPFVVKWEL